LTLFISSCNINIDILKKSAIDNIIISSSELLSIALSVISQVSLFKIVMKNNKCKCTQCLSQADKDTIISLDIDKLLADSEYFGKDMPDFKHELTPYSSDAFLESKNKFIHGVKQPLKVKSAGIKSKSASRPAHSGQIKPKEPKPTKGIFEVFIGNSKNGKIRFNEALRSDTKLIRIEFPGIDVPCFIYPDQLKQLIRDSCEKRHIGVERREIGDTIKAIIEVDKSMLVANCYL